MSTGVKGRLAKGADQMEAATRPEQNALPITSFQGTCWACCVALLRVGSGRILKAFTVVMDPERATKKRPSNLDAIFMVKRIQRRMGEQG